MARTTKPAAGYAGLRYGQIEAGAGQMRLLCVKVVKQPPAGHIDRENHLHQFAGVHFAGIAAEHPFFSISDWNKPDGRISFRLDLLNGLSLGKFLTIKQ